jgi:purine-binding chemotaxis protein CheW
VTQLSHQNRFLVFSLGKEEFALPLLCVKEVIAIPQITRVPRSPEYLLGVMNLRGNIVSIFDLKAKLGVSDHKNQEPVVIICEFPPFTFGVLVSSVEQVMNVTSNDIQDKSSYTSEKNLFIDGIIQKTDRLIILINLEKALNIADIAHLKQEKAKKV